MSTSQLHSHWPTPAANHYTAPYLPPSVLSPTRPPTPSTLTAFDSARAPLLTLRAPALWPDPCPPFSALVHTEAQLAWNGFGLHCLYRIRGPFKLAADDPHVKDTRMHDSRVELFVCPTAASNVYYAFELNSAGRALDFKAELTSAHTADLDFSRSFSVVGQHTCTSQLPADYTYQHLYLMSVPWSNVGVEVVDKSRQGGREEEQEEPSSSSSARLIALVNERDMRVAVLRGEVVDIEGGGATYPHTHLWTTAIDPHSPDITFHTTTVFMALHLTK